MHARLAQPADIGQRRRRGVGDGAEGVRQKLGQFGLGDVTGHRHLDAVGHPMAAGEGAQVGGGNGRNRLDGANRGLGIGVIAEKGAGKGAARHARRFHLVLLQRLDDLGFHARQRIGLEARLHQRHLQQAHRLRRVFFQSGDGDDEVIAFGAGRKADGAVLDGFVESLGRQIARPLVHHRSRKRRQPRFARRIIGRARRHRDVEGDDRNRVILGEPDGGILAQVYILDVGGLRRDRHDDQRKGAGSKRAVDHFEPPGSR